MKTTFGGVFGGVWACAVLAAGTAFGQAPAATVQTAAAAPQAFEVASVKAAGPLDPMKIAQGQQKIGMSVDAAQVDIRMLTLADLVRMAYKIKSHQLQPPAWMNEQRWEIVAKMPEGAKEEQVPEMLQALLAERFKLTIHHDMKEQSVYALIVAKGGHKLKEWTPEADGPPVEGGTVIGNGTNAVRMSGNMQDGKGSMTMSGPKGGTTKMSMTPEGTMRMETNKMPMAALAEMLTRFVDRPVVDMTELKGEYQVVLNLSMDDLRNVAAKAGVAMPGASTGGGAAPGMPGAAPAADPSGPTLLGGLQQLGLKVEPRKAPVDMIVIDHVEKTPTEN